MKNDHEGEQICCICFELSNACLAKIILRVIVWLYREMAYITSDLMLECLWNTDETVSRNDFLKMLSLFPFVSHAQWQEHF